MATFNPKGQTELHPLTMGGGPVIRITLAFKFFNLESVKRTHNLEIIPRTLPLLQNSINPSTLKKFQTYINCGFALFANALAFLPYANGLRFFPKEPLWFLADKNNPR